MQARVQEESLLEPLFLLFQRRKGSFREAPSPSPTSSQAHPSCQEQPRRRWGFNAPHAHKIPSAALTQAAPGRYFFFFYKFIYLFTYFWLCWLFISARGLVAVRGLLIAVASLGVERGL